MSDGDADAGVMKDVFVGVEVEITEGGPKPSTRALVDSGAAFSVISETFLRKYWPAEKYSPVGLPRIETVNGGTVHVKGQVTATLWIEGRELATEMIVAPLREDIIIGIDFLGGHRCIFNMETVELWFKAPRDTVTGQGIRVRDGEWVQPKYSRLYEIIELDGTEEEDMKLLAPLMSCGKIKEDDGRIKMIVHNSTDDVVRVTPGTYRQTPYQGSQQIRVKAAL